jgi:hypothetical protein
LCLQVLVRLLNFELLILLKTISSGWIAGSDDDCVHSDLRSEKISRQVELCQCSGAAVNLLHMFWWVDCFGCDGGTSHRLRGQPQLAIAFGVISLVFGASTFDLVKQT